MDEKASPGSEPGEPEGLLNKVCAVSIRDGKIEASSVTPLPPEAFSQEPTEKKDEGDTADNEPPEKIHPRLQEWIANRSDETELIMITFQDDLQMPRFPEPVDEARDPEAHQNALLRAKELIQQIKERRADDYERLARDLESSYNAQVLETFWLIKAVLVKIRLGILPEVARRDDVQYLEPKNSGEKPPTDANPGNDPKMARTSLDTDPLFERGLTSGRIGLLDTGVRSSHTVFAKSSLGLLRDCVNGGPDCDAGPGFNAEDDCWNHGTSSAAIIIANAPQGSEFRGVTGITLDSFKVYPSSFNGETCDGTFDPPIAVRGFQAAVAALDKVIVAEIQGDGSDRSALSLAADQAFDSGAVIIAANGNNGPLPKTVNAPANAHKAIGVGEIDVESQKQMPNQSRGPTRDGRYKPDIQAPTNTETASNASNEAFQIFSGTSGATPYAAGAAALIRNWLALQTGSSVIDPGQVYVQLILAGQQPYPFNNVKGAGPLRLTIDGDFWSGIVSVTNTQPIDIQLDVTDASATTLDGALWWPENPGPPSLPDVHNDIDLYLVDPTGMTQGVSKSKNSVFERARVAGPIAAGVWILRIQGIDVPGAPQTVYWAAQVQFS